MPIDTSIAGIVIFVACIILFISNVLPASLVAVMGCIFMVTLNVASFECIFGQFACDTVALLIGAMIVSSAMDEAGVTKWLGRKIHRIAGKNEKTFLLACVVGAAAISAFTSNVTTTLLFIPVISGYCAEHKFDVRKMLLPVAMASQVGGSCTLIGSAPQMVATAFLESNYDKTFAFFDFGKVGVLLVGVFVLYVSTIGWKFNQWGTGIALPMEGPQQDAAQGISPVKKKRNAVIVSIVFLVMVVLFYFEPIPVGLTAIAGATICVATGCIKSRKISECVSWNAVVRLGGCLGLMNGVTQSGGINWAAGVIEKWLGDGISPYFAFIILVVLTTLFSEVLANSTAMMLFLPFALSLCQSRGLNHETFAMGLTLASSMAISSPLSATSLMIVSERYYEFRDVVKYGFLFNVIAVVIIIVAVPFFFPI